MSLEDLVNLTRRVNEDGGLLDVLGPKEYAKAAWGKCDQQLRNAYHHLDARNKQVFLDRYFGNPEQRQVFEQNIAFLDWIYYNLNKQMFIKWCTPYLKSDDPQTIWEEYAMGRHHDSLWLLTRTLTSKGVALLRQKATNG